MRRDTAASLLVFLCAMACGPRTTARLEPAEAQRLSAEGILRQADDMVFRYTVGATSARSRWEDRDASIVVTHRSVLIHKNSKVGIDLRAGSSAGYAVERAGSRIRLRRGQGRSAEIWSFEPPADAPGWTRDIRAVIEGHPATGPAKPDSAGATHTPGQRP